MEGSGSSEVVRYNRQFVERRVKERQHQRRSTVGCSWRTGKEETKEFKKSTLQTNASLLINLEQQLALPPRRVTTMNGSSDTSVSSSRNHHQHAFLFLSFLFLPGHIKPTLSSFSTNQTHTQRTLQNPARKTHLHTRVYIYIIYIYMYIYSIRFAKPGGPGANHQA